MKVKKNKIKAFLMGEYDYIGVLYVVKVVFYMSIIALIGVIMTECYIKVRDKLIGLDRNSERRYTIATAVRVHGGGHNNSRQTVFEYSFRGQKYYKRFAMGRCFENYKPNYRLYIYFYISHPEMTYRLNPEQLVPDSIQNHMIPFEGWRQKPPHVYRPCPN